MTARRSLILVLAAVLALTMCSFSVFATDEEEPVLLTTTAAPDTTEEAPDEGEPVSNENPLEWNLSGEGLDASVSNEAEDLDTAVADTVENTAEDLGEAADNAEDTAKEIAEDAEDTVGEIEEEAEEAAKDANAKKPFVKTAGFWILVVLGALILVFVILWIVRPTFREKVKKFIREYKSELKKIVWSSKEDVIKNTKTVVIAIVVTAVVIGLIDLGLGKLIDLVGHIG